MAALLALGREMVPLDKLLALLKNDQEYASNSSGYHLGASEDTRLNSEATARNRNRRLRRASEVFGVLGAATPANSESVETTTDASNVRQIRKALVRASDKLARSAWGSIDLNPEDQIRDFLTDMILDQPQLAQFLDFALHLGECGHNLLDDSATVLTRLDQLRDNALFILAGSMPKRARQTLLHVSHAFETSKCFTKFNDIVLTRTRCTNRWQPPTVLSA